MDQDQAGSPPDEVIKRYTTGLKVEGEVYGLDEGAKLAEMQQRISALPDGEEKARQLLKLDGLQAELQNLKK